MAKGNRVNDGETLKSYTTKLEPSLKRRLDAMVKVQRLGGQRELITCMLKIYEDLHPEDTQRAKELTELLENEPQKIY